MTVTLIIFTIVYLLVSFKFENLPILIEILIGIHAHIIVSIIAIILTTLFKYSNLLSKIQLVTIDIFISYFKIKYY